MPTAFKGSNHLTTQLLLGQNCANLRTAVIVLRGSHHTSLLHQQSGHLPTAPPSALRVPILRTLSSLIVAV